MSKDHTNRFDARMNNIARDFAAGRTDRSLTAARELMAQLQAQPVIDADQLAWAVYYALRSLHAEGSWSDFAALHEGHHAFLAALGPKNHAYACSLMMEACYRLGRSAAIPRWAEACCERRLADGDKPSLQMAMQTARNLLADAGDADGLAELYERLFELGRRAEDPHLSVFVADRALELQDELDEAGTDDDATAARVVQRVRSWLVAHVSVLQGLGRAPGAGVEKTLLALQDAPWLVGEVAKRDSRRAELLRLGIAVFEPAHEGDEAAVLALLEEAQAAGADSDDAVCDLLQRTPLAIAAFAGHGALVQTLLDRGRSSPSRANAQGRTPLSQAADQGHTAIVEVLIADGADPEAPDINQQTALILASWQGHENVVAALLRGQARLDAVDRIGNTALHLAATEDVPGVVRLLLDGGAPADVVTELGHTPLMKAAMEGRLRVVEVLLEAGSDCRREDCYGLTALDWAAREGFPEVATRLRAGARR